MAILSRAPIVAGSIFRFIIQSTDIYGNVLDAGSYLLFGSRIFDVKMQFFSKTGANVSTGDVSDKSGISMWFDRFETANLILFVFVDGTYSVVFSNNGTSVNVVSGQYSITAVDVTSGSTAVLNTVTEYAYLWWLIHYRQCCHSDIKMWRDSTFLLPLTFVNGPHARPRWFMVVWLFFSFNSHSC